MNESVKIKGALLFLYLGKLVELGLVENNNQTMLTAEGFDVAIDAYNNGHRLSEDDMKTLLKHTPGMGEDVIDGVFEMIKHMQEVGFEEMKRKVNELKIEMDEKETGSI